MSSVTEAWKAWQEGLANKDSSKLGEFFTDDFRFVSETRDWGKQETLDWTAEGGFQTAMDNLEVLYENDEVAVVHHDANRGDNAGVAMVVYLKRGDKISSCRVVRTAT